MKLTISEAHEQLNKDTSTRIKFSKTFKNFCLHNKCGDIKNIAERVKFSQTSKQINNLSDIKL